MAISRSVTFEAPSDKVWGAVVKLIRNAGYAVVSTDQGARQIVYQASGGAFAWGQNVQVSVTDLGEDETMVTIVAEAAGQATLTEGGQQRKFIAFVVRELEKRFPLAEEQPSDVDAPGAHGCFGVALALGAGLLAFGYALRLLVA